MTGIKHHFHKRWRASPFLSLALLSILIYLLTLARPLPALVPAFGSSWSKKITLQHCYQ